MNKLKGHRVLYRVGGSWDIREGVVTEFAGEGDKYVNVGGGWYEAEKVTVVADLGSQEPTLLPGAAPQVQQQPAEGS